MRDKFGMQINSVIEYEEVMDGEYLQLTQYLLHEDGEKELDETISMNRQTALELANVILQMFGDKEE